ncbi:MAG: hypothetical protein QG635_1357 [Bacteroidota bacterium]|nr:hypothetical protein [Bacteroidota bacterium]
MKSDGKLELINEIKALERSLYSKKSKLGSLEAMDSFATETMLPHFIGGHGLDTSEWKKDFKKLISTVGDASTGGNSVEDIHNERNR